MAIPDIQAQRQKFFAGRRGEIQQQGNAQTQEAQDAIARRMTSIGQGASGAALAAQAKAREGIMQQTQAAQNDLAGQEMQAQFQEEGLLDQVRAREFAAKEAALGRDFQGGMAEKDMTFKRGLFDVEQGNKIREMDLAERQFALDKDTTEFNRRMAEIEAAKKDPGLFGGGGFLGTGLGGGSGGTKRLLGTGIGFAAGGPVGAVAGNLAANGFKRIRF